MSIMSKCYYMDIKLGYKQLSCFTHFMQVVSKTQNIHLHNIIIVQITSWKISTPSTFIFYVTYYFNNW